MLRLGGVSFPFSFQFFTRLAAVFAEEVGDFGVGAHDGYTPLDRAVDEGQIEIAALLRKHGGKTGEELEAEGK